MSGKDSDDPGDDLENLYTPEESKVLQQEVELWNGVKMRQSQARSEYDFLCRLYEEKPELFRALVILYKQEPTAISPECLTTLRDRQCIDDDGAVRAPLAAVLDAAYQQETSDNIPLRYPIRHASPEEADRFTKIYDQIIGTAIPRRFLRHVRGQDKPDDKLPPH